MITESPTSFPFEHPRTSTANSSLWTSFSGCTGCNARLNARNLVVCIDGTSNQFGQNNTNVVKLFDSIDLGTTDPKQFTYYSSGIGTRPKSSYIFDRVREAISDRFDMALAWNIDKNIKEAYGWLAGKYHDGDRIFVFGFSRGAYQARVLTGMIHEVGLIRTPTEKQIATAYNHYDAIRPGNPEAKQIARKFKKTFSWKGVKVHFLGVWDTVSSVGLTRGDIPSMSSSACHIRHALALDERRVKFRPEYFHEMNSRTRHGTSKYVVTSLDLGHDTTSANERRKASTSDDGADMRKPTATDVKEVWFAGSHSDVGGTDKIGKFHKVGNISMLWMRREAVAHGLVLHPTDIAWGPQDLDLGISNSMIGFWRAMESLAIWYRLSISGTGDDARRMSRPEPRQVMPGQKVHASILYANAYRPEATWGVGFDVPMIYARPEDVELDDRFWETDMFGENEAKDLVYSLAGHDGLTQVHIDKLLFMLRFKQGRQCVRHVPDWQDIFERIIKSKECVPLHKLVAIVAYYEASSDPHEHSQSPSQPRMTPSKDAFDDAKSCLSDILEKHKHRDIPRVVTLLRPLTKHEDLKERILTKDVIDTLVDLLDKIVGQQDENFVQAMDGLNSLLQCKDTRKIIIKDLEDKYPNSNVSRLSRILKVKDSLLLVSALRMVLTLARLPEVRTRPVWDEVKPRIRDLAKKPEGLIGLIAVEILLAVYNPEEEGRGQLNIVNSDFRENLASALLRMNLDSHGPSGGPRLGVDPGQQVLCSMFGLDAENLDHQQQSHLRILKFAVQTGNARERTAATMTFLKLCETQVIRTYLIEIDLLGVFIRQLKHKKTALLAAYALATCLKYKDLKEALKKNQLFPKHIVGMLRMDFFDDAVGQVEGFQIFGNIMRDDDIREKIKEYDIPRLLAKKLKKGKSKEIRTSLICLEIFHSFDKDGPWASKLVEKSLEHLRHSDWRVQKVGVTILSALSQTEHGVVAIIPVIPKIIEMLLPEGYRPIERTTSATQAFLGEGSIHLPNGSAYSPSIASESTDILSKPPACMMGPACALRILAQNHKLRECTRCMGEYASLKHLYISGMLVGRKNTQAWRVRTPTESDVTDMLDKMIDIIDDRLSAEDDPMFIGDIVPPHIQHWNVLLSYLRKHAWKMVTFPFAVLSGLVLGLVGGAAILPISLSIQTYGLFKRVWTHYENARFLDSLHRGRDGGPSQAGHGGQNGSTGNDQGPRDDETKGGGERGDASADAEMVMNVTS